MANPLAATAQSDMGAAAVIGHPAFDQTPAPEDMASYYPDRAQRLELQGRAVVRCLVAPDGAISGDCQILQESPPGFGFGAATIRAARRFHLRSPGREGYVTIPINWRLGTVSRPGDYALFLDPKPHPLTWAERPSEDQLRAFYPAHAFGLGLVTLSCTATPTGQLDHCAAKSGSPTDLGFADEAMKVAALFRVAAPSDGASLQGAKIQVFLRFLPPTDAQWTTPADKTGK
jgi:TonB family protein